MSPEFAIETKHLQKFFNGNPAVKDLNLQVNYGEVFGFLGPNGAGKTTTIKILLGLVKPTGGDATILGSPISDHTARKHVGFLPEHFRFHGWLTARELLTLHGQLAGMGQILLEERISRLIERVNLTTFADTQIKTFSKGMLQRIGLAQALVNKPSLVFLDEPTSGLDPGGRMLVRDIIEELKQEGITDRVL